MLENPRPRGSDASHSREPQARGCEMHQTSRGLWLPTQQLDEVLNNAVYHDKIYFAFRFLEKVL